MAKKKKKNTATANKNNVNKSQQHKQLLQTISIQNYCDNE